MNDHDHPTDSPRPPGPNMDRLTPRIDANWRYKLQDLALAMGFEDPNSHPSSIIGEAVQRLSSAEQPLKQAGPLRWSSNTTPNLDAALAAAQGEMRNAEENRKNTHLGSSYADLGSVIRAVRGPLSRHAIARYQSVYTTDRGALMVTTRLAHAGEWVEADFTCEIESMKGLKMIQNVGNVVTYAKRYALGAMCGIGTGEDEDDDGNAEPVSAQTLDQRWDLAVEAWSRADVASSVVLAMVNRASQLEVTAADHDKLEALYRDLRNGHPAAKAKVDAARARVEGCE